MKRYLIFSFLSFVFFLFSCKRDFSVPDTYNIKLTIESVEVVETWLKLQVTPIDTEAIYTVKRDTQIIFSGKLEKIDTMLHDENLKPAQTYTYIAFREGSMGTATEVEAATMDTTSHDFEWQVFEFGDHSSNYFSDVAIINENNIWAVGKIYTDSSDFNAAHWNGNKWDLKKIPVKIFNTNSFITADLKTVYAFNTNNIYVTTGGEVIHYNGNEWSDWTFLFTDLNDTTFGGVNKFWGLSDDDFYGVGNKGNIFRYNGEIWQKLDSGTEVNINDIWGYYNEHSGEDYILCPASFKYQLGDKKLLNIKEDYTIQDETWPYADRRVHSVWFKNNQKVMVCGAGVFVRNRFGIWKEYSELPLIFTNRIRGNDLNDIFVAGDFGFIAHFNGLNWFKYEDAAIALFHSIDFQNNCAVAVGERNNRAVILLMQR